MDFEPFDSSFRFPTDIFIEDFPDYLIEQIRRWIRTTFYSAGVASGSSMYRDTVDALELRLRAKLSSDVSSLISWMTNSPAQTKNMLSLVLQNFANQDRANELKDLLRQASSAYTVEPHGTKYILATRQPEAQRLQAETALEQNELLKAAYISCYQVEPDYTDAVRKANDAIEGILKEKFWPDLQGTYSISQAIKRFEKENEILSFKGSTFVKDSAKVIGLLDGIANIRGEHTTGNGRAPTPDEAEYVVQTAIYLFNLFEPVVPIA